MQNLAGPATVLIAELDDNDVYATEDVFDREM